MSERVLIITTDGGLRSRFASLAEGQGWRPMEASTLRDALSGLRARTPQVLMIEGADANPEAIALLVEACPQAAVCVLHDSLEELDTERLFEAGCQDLLELPLSAPKLQLAFARALRNRDVRLEADWMRQELDKSRRTTLTGRSRAILRIRDQVQRIASTPRTTVLVTGEAGSGKERVARAIHQASARAARPFVLVACGLSDPERLETLLYGQHSDAPPGPLGCALANAEGGTLYLSQIEHIGANVQRRILQLLQDRTWTPGEHGEDRLADLRVIASSNVDLTRLVDEGRFREDLLYRLNVLSVEVPPLRERREDLPDLIHEELELLGLQLGRPGKSLAPDAIEALAQHGWSGNLQELHNALERGALAASGHVITRSDLGLIPPAGGTLPVNTDQIELESFQLRHMEEVVIRRALQSTRGNRSETARLLGVNRTTLYNKLRAYEIDG